jgi:hypothetical protein
MDDTQTMLRPMGSRTGDRDTPTAAGRAHNSSLTWRRQRHQTGEICILRDNAGRQVDYYTVIHYNNNNLAK